MRTTMPKILVMGRSGPGTRVLDDPAQTDSRIAVDTPAWWSWLAAATTYRFAYPVYDPAVGYIAGFMTVRKERRQRGGWYWSVYRRRSGQLQRIYLGGSSRLTQARLEEIAQTFWSTPARDAA